MKITKNQLADLIYEIGGIEELISLASYGALKLHNRKMNNAFQSRDAIFKKAAYNMADKYFEKYLLINKYLN